ncbi:MAG: cupin domain-containing protein [Shimia sp.]
MQNIRAEALLFTPELRDDIPFWQGLGFRMDEIFPADDPREAVFSGHGLRLRVRKGDGPAGTVRILADDPMLIADGASELTAPSGARVEIAALAPPVVMPPTAHGLHVRRLADNAPWIVGRAGMEYRDLVPDRLGGAMIASHIRIPEGGPVPDMVHYHSVGFQLIFCIKGWVDLVYEDQGPPFRLHAGNCVIQPPEIRHRVLHASDGLEVIEIGLPAEHITTIDHAMELPTPNHLPDREWAGQRFVHHLAEGAEWTPHAAPGYIARDTGIAAHTGGVADVKVLRADDTPGRYTDDADINFVFVMSGEVRLVSDEAHPLRAGDAAVIPPGAARSFEAPSGDLELLEVRLPRPL